MAVVLRDGGGSQRDERRREELGPVGGRRPPGRRRIATRRARGRRRGTRLWPSSSGTAEDRNARRWCKSAFESGVAVVLRDGGGSQPGGSGGAGPAARGWPSSSGTAEDRNVSTAATKRWSARVAVVLRDGGGSQPLDHVHAGDGDHGGRRPPGRRRIATRRHQRMRSGGSGVAVVLQDGGGPRPRPGRRRRAVAAVAVVLRIGRRPQLRDGGRWHVRPRSGCCPPGGRRVATSAPTCSYGASPRVAAVFRNGGGSQPGRSRCGGSSGVVDAVLRIGEGSPGVEFGRNGAASASRCARGGAEHREVPGCQPMVPLSEAGGARSRVDGPQHHGRVTDIRCGRWGRRLTGGSTDLFRFRRDAIPVCVRPMAPSSMCYAHGIAMPRVRRKSERVWRFDARGTAVEGCDSRCS